MKLDFLDRVARLLYGRLVGRNARVPRDHEAALTRRAMRPTLTVLTMVRNEAGLIRESMRHLCALFDRVIVIDHLSNDGTYEFLLELRKLRGEISVLRFDEPAYYQAEIMTWSFQNLIDPTLDDWVFCLDADEFLPFASRSALLQELERFSHAPVISMRWQNLVPRDLRSDAVIGATFLRPSRAANLHKVAFQPRLLPQRRIRISEGNHSLNYADGRRRPLPPTPAFDLYHVPLRSCSQIEAKVRQGLQGYRRMGAMRGKDHGSHWESIERVLQTTGLTESVAIDMAARYGQQLTHPLGTSFESLLEQGFVELRLDVAAACDEDWPRVVARRPMDSHGPTIEQRPRSIDRDRLVMTEAVGTVRFAAR